MKWRWKCRDGWFKKTTCASGKGLLIARRIIFLGAWYRMSKKIELPSLLEDDLGYSLEHLSPSIDLPSSDDIDLDIICLSLFAFCSFLFAFFLSSSQYTSKARRSDSLDPRLNVLKSLFSMRFVALCHWIRVNGNTGAHLCGPCFLESLFWTPIIHHHILIIFENSSKCFRHWIETYLVEITVHIDTHPYEVVLKQTSVSNERGEFWRDFSKPHPSSIAPFQHAALSNTIRNTY